MGQLMEVCGRDHTHRLVQFGQFMLSTYCAATMGREGSKAYSLLYESSQSWREDVTKPNLGLLAYVQ